MLIANPIYDVVFKHLMENEKAATFFISTLLQQPIESIEFKPQEFTYSDKLAGIAIFRLDFVATIQTGTGEHKKVLIEIQKARNMIDLMRFRSYLAEQYKKEDTIAGERVALPITTIYILGFTLPEIATPCLRVQRKYRDLVGNKVLRAKSDFVEKLTHDCYIIQVERITGQFQTPLDKLLSLFEQSHFDDDTTTLKNYAHTPDTEALKTMTDILHRVGTDPVTRKAIETEREAWRSVNAMFADTRRKFEKALGEQQKALDKQKKTLKEQKKTLTEQKQALGEKDKALGEKDKVLNEQQKILGEQQKALAEQAKLIEELLKKTNPPQ
jgi:hypothetical protein